SFVSAITGSIIPSYDSNPLQRDSFVSRYECRRGRSICLGDGRVFSSHHGTHHQGRFEEQDVESPKLGWSNFVRAQRLAELLTDDARTETAHRGNPTRWNYHHIAWTRWKSSFEACRGYRQEPGRIHRDCHEGYGVSRRRRVYPSRGLQTRRN